MQKHISFSLLVLGVIIALVASAVAGDWAIKANYTESCSCNPTCPCVFGSPSTLGYCEGNNLIEMKEAHYGDVSLDGISVVMAFSLGKWVKIYVSDEATDEQAKAAVELIKLEPTFGMLFSGKTEILSTEKAPISVEKTSTKVKFSVPVSMVELEIMKGQDGKPIKIQNLPMAFMNDHTQYKAIVTSHKSEDKNFKHSGTNGLTSRLEASSKN